MTPHLSVSDAEIEAVTQVFRKVPDLGARLMSDEAHALIRAALTAAAETRCPELVRADGAVFKVGASFSCGRTLWRCTDIGTRTVTAVRMDRVVRPRRLGENETWATEQDRIDPRKHPGWLLGPPYKLAEFSFDEEDIEIVTPVPREKVPAWEPDPGEGVPT